LSVPDQAANAASFDSARDDVFGRIASRYDVLCDLFSLCIHRAWKRRVAFSLRLLCPSATFNLF
jgi:demethylmenaquinone methyltransferase/2-methoxy-6-polyprenyl-1,4-benzoquinol methylase